MSTPNPLSSSGRPVETARRFYDHYRYDLSAIIGYLAGIVASILIFLFAVSPQYEAIAVLQSQGSEAQKKLESLRIRGISLDTFKSIAKQQKADIAFLLQDMKLSQKAMAKPKNFSGTYADWTSAAAKEVDALNEQNSRNDLAISEILPFYTSSDPALGTSTNVRRMNTANFVSYIENNLLRRFSISSDGSLGFARAKFSADRTLLPIGTYQISLVFHGKNRDILRMIDFIQKTGAFTIEDGQIRSLNTSNVRDVSDTLPHNLLLTIDTLSLTERLVDDDSINNGTLVLETFVRGLSDTEILRRRELFSEDFRTFSKLVDTSASPCIDANICQDTSVRLAAAGIRSIQSTLMEMENIPLLKSSGKRKGDDPEKILQDVLKYERSLEILKDQFNGYMTTIQRARTDLAPNTATPASTSNRAASRTSAPLEERTVSGAVSDSTVHTGANISRMGTLSPSTTKGEKSSSGSRLHTIE